MKILDLVWHRLVYPACLVYTVITLLFGAIAATGNPSFAPTVYAMGLFLAFGFLFAACNLILHIKSWVLILRYAVHYTAMMLSMYMVLFLPTGNTQNIRAMMLLGVIYTLCYLIFASIHSALQKKKTKENSQEEKTYKRQFKGL